MKQKPGVMIYFDIRKSLDQLSDRDAGILFRNILQYAQTRIVGEMPPKVRLVWPMVQIRLDLDNQQYHKKVTKSRYGAYVTWAKRHDKEPMSYEDWMEQHGYQTVSSMEEADFYGTQLYYNGG